MTPGEHGEAVTSNRDTLAAVATLHRRTTPFQCACGHRDNGTPAEFGAHVVDALMPTVEAMLAQARAEVTAAVEAVCVEAEQETADMDREAGEPVGTLTPYLGISLVRAAVSGTDHDTTLDTVRAREDGIRQAMTWLRADYTYGEGPDWREDGAQWIADRLADETKARADRIAPDDTPSERGGDDAA